MDTADDRSDNGDLVSHPRGELAADTLVHVRDLDCPLGRSSYAAARLPQEAVVEVLRDGQGAVEEAADGTGCRWKTSTGHWEWPKQGEHGRHGAASKEVRRASCVTSTSRVLRGSVRPIIPGNQFGSEPSCNGSSWRGEYSMLRARPRTLLVSLVLGLISMVLLAAAVAAQQPITITLSEQNNSGISGTAVLTPMGNQTRVTLTMTGSAGGPHPVHIHTGQCPTPGGIVANLTPIQNGTSETIVDLSLDQIRGARHAINAHKSPQEVSVYIACGDLPLAAAGAGGGGTGGATGGGAAGGAAGAGGMPRTGEGGGAGQLSQTLLAVGSLLLAALGVMALRRRLA